MAKIVRDGEIMVVCKEANDEAKIATDIKIAIGPRMGPERTAKIDSWLSGFPAPSPWSPMPAQETTPRVTRIYTEMMINIVRLDALPGVFDGFFVSSFMVSTASQPQNIKIDRDIPAANREKSPISAGLNQSQLIGVGRNPEQRWACASAAIGKATSTSSWKPTSRYCNFGVVANPRYATQAATAIKSNVVGIFIRRLSVHVAMTGF